MPSRRKTDQPPTPTQHDKPNEPGLTREQLHRLFGKPLPDGRILIEALADALCPGWREEGRPAA